MNLNVLNMTVEKLTENEREMVERYKDDVEEIPVDLKDKLERNGEAYENWLLYRRQLDDML
jgi:hypothetical protein